MPMSSHQQQFTHLFSQHYRWLRSRVSRTLGCHFRADDVAADTFVRILGMPDLSAIREPRTLLSTIAKRLIIDNWRREDLERAYLATLGSEAENTVPDPDTHAQLLESLLLLDRLLSDLAPQGKEAFLLSLFEGLTYEQIGVRLGISKSRVHQHVEKAYLLCLEVIA